MKSIIANTGPQVLRGEFQFSKQDFEGQKLIFKPYFDGEIGFDMVRPVLTCELDGREQSFMFKDLIGPGSDLLRDSLDTNGSSLDKSELSQALGSGRIAPVLQSDVDTMLLSEQKLKRLSRQWLPLPVCSVDSSRSSATFKEDMVPMLWFEVEDATLRFVVAIDSDALGPFAPGEDFVIGNISTMVDHLMGGRWASYLQRLWLKGAENEEDLQAQIDAVAHTWDATYRLFVSWFSRKSSFSFRPIAPSGDKIDVNVYVDFGNDSTSVILREENHAEDGGQEFEQVKEIELFNFKKPLERHTGPFSTNIAFRRGRFMNESRGDFGAPKSNSISSLGSEATQLLNEEGLQNATDPRQIGCQSPKRFLWDNSKTKKPWVFADAPAGGRDEQVQKAGVTDRMTGNGTYVPVGQAPPSGQEVGPLQKLYSKSSLTTFVFLEIFDQVFRQINSSEFRSSHGSLSSARVLKQVTVSCPTGMSKVEQVALRKAAEDALLICGDTLEIFNSPLYADATRRPKIKPSSKELKIPNSELDEREQWAYDEASVGQFVWLYSEMVHKRSVNVKLFKEDFGVREKIRVASIDIGAGTADVMVCDHELGSNVELVEVRPCPIFWDSMPLAGHDLLEKVVSELVVMGTPSQPGMLLEAMLSKDVANAKEKLVRIFGKNSANQTVDDRAKRAHLLQNLIVPIARDLLSKANQEDEIVIDVSSYMNDEFLKRNGGLVQYVRLSLGVDLSQISWTCPAQRVNSVTIDLFENQIATVSRIFHGSKPDVVLLSGGVFKSDALEALARKCSGIPGCRIVNLNNYEVGTWYPWVNEFGQLRHGKSLVAIGSALADLAERSKLRGMSLKIDRLIAAIRNDKLFISQKSSNGDVRSVMSALDSEGTLKTAQLPIRLLSSPVASSKYPLRSAYRLDYDHETINLAFADLDVQDAVEKIGYGAPFEFRLTRGEDNREVIEVEDVACNNDDVGTNVRPSFFKVYFESLPNGDFWMERGLSLTK